MHSNRSVGRGLDLVPNLEHGCMVAELLRHDHREVRGAAVGWGVTVAVEVRGRVNAWNTKAWQVNLNRERMKRA